MTSKEYQAAVNALFSPEALQASDRLAERQSAAIQAYSILVRAGIPCGLDSVGCIINPKDRARANKAIEEALE